MGNRPQLRRAAELAEPPRGEGPLARRIREINQDFAILRRGAARRHSRGEPQDLLDLGRRDLAALAQLDHATRLEPAGDCGGGGD